MNLRKDLYHILGLKQIAGQKKKKNKKKEMNFSVGVGWIFFIYRFLALFIGEYDARSKWQLIFNGTKKILNGTLSAGYSILKLIRGSTKS